MLHEHRRLLRGAFERHDGVEVDTQGYAFFFAFGRATDAVKAAIDGQAAVTGGTVRVRMGLHTGDAVAGEEGYVGVGVHRAARICAAAHGGQILLSASSAQLIDVDLHDLGEHRQATDAGSWPAGASRLRAPPTRRPRSERASGAPSAGPRAIGQPRRTVRPSPITASTA